MRAYVLGVWMLSVASAGYADSTTVGPGVAPTDTPVAGHAAPFVSTASTDRIPDRRKLRLRSDTVLIIDQARGDVIYAKNSRKPKSIASITKLMTAMVILDANLPPDEPIAITSEDKDRLRWSRSYLPIGSELSRMELLQVALMSSENRAAAALARTFPGGTPAFIRAMNDKAASLGMHETTLVDATGLHSDNQSTAEDLSVMLRSAWQYPEIRRMTTTPSLVLNTRPRTGIKTFRNTNLLVRKRRREWDIGLSKTGYILEAGRCLVMQAEIAGRPLFIVLLDAWGKYTSIGDANRIRKWLLSATSSSREVG